MAFELTVENLAFAYQDSLILRDVSFQLHTGEIASLIGESGAGKTTLFRLLTGLLPLQKGTVSFSGRVLPKMHELIAYMRQEDLLLPWRNILDNMMLVGELGHNCSSSLELQAEAREILVTMGLEHATDLFPEQLSVGMRQRASLARALLQKRPLLLLDEPFSSVDVNVREKLYSMLRQYNQNYNTTILMITHDFRDAVSLSDHILLLDDGVIAHTWQITKEQHCDTAFQGKLVEEIRTAFL